MDYDLLQRLALALAIGLLVGLERGWKERKQPDGARAAGFRTYSLIGLLGGIWALLSQSMGGIVLGLAGIGFMAVFAFFEWRDNKASNNYSATGLVAASLVFALGAYAVLGDKLIAAATAVTATILLAEREVLHGFLKRLQWIELRAALILLAMSVVLLPVLPNETVDPWDALNPFQLWLMVILIAGISYAGYIAVKLAGARKGLLVVGAAGGLVSSTTVTLTLSQLAKNQEGGISELRAGIAIAWAVSFARMSAIAMIVAPSLIPLIGPPAAIATLILGLTALQALWKPHKGATSVKALVFKNPFDLLIVFTFGAVLAAFMLATKLISEAMSGSALPGFVAISGLFDVDPITLSVAQMSGSSSISADYAVLLILLAGGTNLIGKCGVTLSLAGFRFALPLLVAALLAAAGAAGAIILI
jgi:uncharacterized membrane protein (DUF4010 family)